MELIKWNELKASEEINKMQINEIVNFGTNAKVYKWRILNHIFD
jgi:hypothetical protein